jgi:hypothetical protein
MRSTNVRLLTLLGSAAEQNHKPIAVAPEVDAVAGSKVDPKLQHATSHTSHVRKIAVLESRHRDCHFCCAGLVEPFEPLTERASASAIQIFQDPHLYSILYVTNYRKRKSAR